MGQNVLAGSHRPSFLAGGLDLPPPTTTASRVSSKENTVCQGAKTRPKLTNTLRHQGTGLMAQGLLVMKGRMGGVGWLAGP